MTNYILFSEVHGFWQASNEWGNSSESARVFDENEARAFSEGQALPSEDQEGRIVPQKNYRYETQEGLAKELAETLETMDASEVESRVNNMIDGIVRIESGGLTDEDFYFNGTQMSQDLFFKKIAEELAYIADSDALAEFYNELHSNIATADDDSGFYIQIVL